MSRYFIGVAPWYPGPAGPRAHWSAPDRTSRHHAHTAITQPVSDGAMDEQITPRRRLGRGGIVAIVAVLGALSVGGAVAMATGNGGDPPTTAASSTTTVHDHSTATGQGRRAGKHTGHHDHPALTPYAQRVEAATGAQRKAAADLQAEVRETLAAYTDVDAAVAAGYRPPRRPDALLAHYANRANVRDGKVLDPTKPEGLVYWTGGPGRPVLLGAFFVALKGQAVPGDAGGIVVWHSHDPACTGFFATAEAPCTGQFRMLHVWTFDQATLTRPRTGKQVTVKLTDPFGVPFKASVERAA